MKRILILLTLTFVFQGQALAARHYRVEMLVFQNLAPQAFRGEYWPADPGTPNLNDTRPLGDLTPAATRLDGIAHRLDASGRYRVLFHRAWIQNLGRNTPTPWFRLDEASSKLQGKVQVTRGRFLHVRLDLRLQGPVPQGWVLGEAPASEVRGFPYRMQARRKMRRDKLHYLDHPLLGVIVRIARAE